MSDIKVMNCRVDFLFPFAGMHSFMKLLKNYVFVLSQIVLQKIHQ